MSLAYRAPIMGNGAFWVLAAVASLGVHFALPISFLAKDAAQIAPTPEDQGVTGAILFDLSDIIAAPSGPAEDSVAQEESAAAPTVTESPEAVEATKAADQPMLNQSPFEVEDDSLKFAMAAPEPEVEAEKIAEEIATEFDPEQVDTASQLGAEDKAGSVASVSGIEAEQEAETATAESEGLTAARKAELQEWQKAVVVKISKAKTYPPQARRQKVTGEVHIRFTLDSYGHVLTAEVATSSGWPVLDQAALRTIKNIGKMPTPPSHLGQEQLSLMIPLRYRFR